MKEYKEARSKFGRFYYRFPDGESGLDVYCRVSSFIGTLFRFADYLRDIAHILYCYCREWSKEQHALDFSESTIIVS